MGLRFLATVTTHEYNYAALSCVSKPTLYHFFSLSMFGHLVVGGETGSNWHMLQVHVRSCQWMSSSLLPTVSLGSVNSAAFTSESSILWLFSFYLSVIHLRLEAWRWFTEVPSTFQQCLTDNNTTGLFFVSFITWEILTIYKPNPASYCKTVESLLPVLFERSTQHKIVFNS